MNLGRNIHSLSTIALASGLLLFSSCTKDSDSTPGSANAEQIYSQQITNKDTKRKMQELKEDIPTVAIYNSTMDKYILFNINKMTGEKSFTFASPGFAASFSSPGSSYTFATAPDGTGYIMVNQGGGFGAGGGGTVTAGSTVLVLNYVMCFSADEDALGGDLFDFGGTNVDGFSGAVGISGDFEALTEGNFDENSNPLDYFYGMVFYYIFDDNPSGEYDVIDFFTESEPNVNDYALALLISFQNDGGIYFSSDGTLTFSGSSIDFNGQYFGLTDFFIGFGENEEAGASADFEVVDGWGQINCS